MGCSKWQNVDRFLSYRSVFPTVFDSRLTVKLMVFVVYVLGEVPLHERPRFFSMHSPGRTTGLHWQAAPFLRLMVTVVLA